MTAYRPNRRLPATSRALALHRPRPFPSLGGEWVTAAVALAALTVALLWP